MRAIEAPTRLPDFDGVDAFGNETSLFDHVRAGRYALVWWHPQVLTPAACKTCNGNSTPIALLTEIYEFGCDVIGLSYEKPERLAKYLYDIGLEYPMLSVSEAAARSHGAAKSSTDSWPGLPRPIAYLMDEHGQVINSYDVHDPTTFLRIVRDDVKAGPPPSKWEPVKKRKKFLGIL